MKTRKHLLAALGTFAFGVLLVMPTLALAAAPAIAPAKPIDLYVSIGGRKSVADLADYIGVLYKWFISAAMIVAAFMISVGGFQYVTAGAIPKNLSAAKTRITNALVGLLLAISSYVILYTINPAMTNLKLPEIKRIEKINLKTPITACGSYQSEADCKADPNSVGKETKGCQWILPTGGKGACVGKQILLGKNGGTCGTTEPRCDADLTCVRSVPLTGGGIQDVCTDGLVGSVCEQGVNQDKSGCNQDKLLKCTERGELPRCVASIIKDSGQSCEANEECKSKVCFHKACADPNKMPAFCRSASETCPQDKYCCTASTTCIVPADVGVCLTLITDGGDCMRNDECASKACSNSVGKGALASVTDAGKCLFIDGAPCSASTDCKSQLCSLVEGSTTDKVCTIATKPTTTTTNSTFPPARP